MSRWPGTTHAFVASVFGALAFMVGTAGGASAHTRERPVPENIWQAWNLDVPLLGALILMTWLYQRGARTLWSRAGRSAGLSRWRVGSYLAGIGTIVVALVSPLDAMGGALFSAHMAQHMLLLLVAPLLLAAGRPVIALLWALPPVWRKRLTGWWMRRSRLRAGWHGLNHPLAVFAIFGLALWGWHLPRLYDAALGSDGLHRLEHAAFFLSAFLLWWCVLETGQRRGMTHGQAMLFLFASTIQSGALGAILTFARQPLYERHEPYVSAWGLTRLEDQQLAGVVMWVPMGTWLALAAFIVFGLWIRSAGQSVAQWEAASPLQRRVTSGALTEGRGGDDAVALQNR